MIKSVCILGFWFHITFDGNNGIDQRGNKWINPNNPEPNEKGLIDAILDASNNINNKIARNE